MSPFLQTALVELERLGPLLGVRASLDVSRACAPLPVELAARVLAGVEDEARGRAFIQALTDVVLVLSEDFPDNIFWDLDYLACRLWNAGGPRDIEVFSQRVVRLFRGFGNKSELRFRYAHDFLFGFDWARWVAREPSARAGIGPFDLAFFDYLDSRRQTLLELISDNDTKYHQLDGPAFRNPFTFLREPHEEVLLHQVLAREDHIPVKAWRMDGECRWELPFSDLRAAAARRLGIGREESP